MHMDMAVPRGPDIREIALLDAIAFLFELIDDGRHGHRIPPHDRVGNKIETARLISQCFAPLATQLTFILKFPAKSGQNQDLNSYFSML